MQVLEHGCFMLEIGRQMLVRGRAMLGSGAEDAWFSFWPIPSQSIVIFLFRPPLRRCGLGTGAIRLCFLLFQPPVEKVRVVDCSMFLKYSLSHVSYGCRNFILRRIRGGA